MITFSSSLIVSSKKVYKKYARVKKYNCTDNLHPIERASSVVALKRGKQRANCMVPTKVKTIEYTYITPDNIMILYSIFTNNCKYNIHILQ